MNFAISKRKTLTVSQEALVQSRLLHPAQDLPLVIEPGIGQVDLFAWAEENRDFIQAKLMSHGAVLFRNFSIVTVESFHLLVKKIAREALQYKERSSPRSEVGENIYTSTDYPADQSIFPHNEHSYSLTFPLKLFFWCQIPAQLGGETPLGNTRKIYHRIPREIREEFAAKGWMFVRNFNTGFGLPWQTVFQTSDRTAVQEYCTKAGIEWEWRDGDKLRTRQVRPAIVKHPVTCEPVWFNHATFFHITTLQPQFVTTLRSDYAEDELPNNTFYGDGSSIPDDVIGVLREAYAQEMISFPWQAGDVVLIDNMLTAHARAPFVGPRRILVAMAEPCDAKSLAR